MSAASSRTGRSLLLLAPLLFFLIGFFVWPLFSMMSQSVSDPAVLRLLPRSAEVLADWDRNSPPTIPMQTALMKDLKAVNDDQALGDMVRRLNSARSGFRTLMGKTTSALKETANLARRPRFHRQTLGKAGILAGNRRCTLALYRPPPARRRRSGPQCGW